MKPRTQWEIPPKLWTALVLLVLAVIVLFGGLLIRQELNQRANDHRDADLRRDLCALTTGLAGGPTPAAGPAGDRARDLIPKMDRLRETTCGKRTN